MHGAENLHQMLDSPSSIFYNVIDTSARIYYAEHGMKNNT